MEPDPHTPLQPYPPERGQAHASAQSLADGRRRALRTRARRIRRAVAGGTLALFAAAFLTIYVQLASGHDPALSSSAVRRSAATAASGSSSSKQTGTSSSSGAVSTSASGASSTGSGSGGAGSGGGESSSSESQSTEARSARIERSGLGRIELRLGLGDAGLGRRSELAVIAHHVAIVSAPTMQRHALPLSAGEHAESTRSFACFGSGCAVYAIGDGPSDSAEDAVELARRELLGWHERFSRFLPQSELSLLNGDRRAVVPASALMCRLAQAVRDAGSATGGLVDATLVDELERAGYAGQLGRPLSRAAGVAERAGAPACPRQRDTPVAAHRGRPQQTHDRAPAGRAARQRRPREGAVRRRARRRG